jgi:hypothetical protein
MDTFAELILGGGILLAVAIIWMPFSVLSISRKVSRIDQRLARLVELAEAEARRDIDNLGPASPLKRRA